MKTLIKQVVLSILVFWLIVIGMYFISAFVCEALDYHEWGFANRITSTTLTVIFIMQAVFHIWQPKTKHIRP